MEIILFFSCTKNGTESFVANVIAQNVMKKVSTVVCADMCGSAVIFLRISELFCDELAKFSALLQLAHRLPHAYASGKNTIHD